MRLLPVAVVVACAPGCGSRNDATSGADARADDAPMADAPETRVDAPEVLDSVCGGPSPSCVTAPTTLLPIPDTSDFANMARVGNTLYVSTYEIANNGSPYVAAGRIVAVDLTTGDAANLLPATLSYSVWGANGAAYAVEDAASATIWRIQPGTAPVALLTSIPYPRVATADATHVYWSERLDSTTDVIKRRALGGGTSETIMNCATAWSLAVDDTYVYCAEFGQNLYRALKTGGDRTPIAGSTYPYTAMIGCAGTLYTTNAGEQQVYAVPTPTGPASSFATVTGIGRFYGVTATQQHLYVTTLGPTMYKISRADASYVPLTATADSESNPLVWNGQLLYLARDIGVQRCVD